MKRFFVTAPARRDLLKIWQYLDEQAGEKPADRVTADFYAAIQLLAEHPGMGHIRSDVTTSKYRFWSVYKYVIAYRIDRKPLTIARVIHGARDFRKIFR